MNGAQERELQADVPYREVVFTSESDKAFQKLQIETADAYGTEVADAFLTAWGIGYAVETIAERLGTEHKTAFIKVYSVLFGVLSMGEQFLGIVGRLKGWSDEEIGARFNAYAQRADAAVALATVKAEAEVNPVQTEVTES